MRGRAGSEDVSSGVVDMGGSGVEAVSWGKVGSGGEGGVVGSGVGLVVGFESVM